MYGEHSLHYSRSKRVPNRRKTNINCLSYVLIIMSWLALVQNACCYTTSRNSSTRIIRNMGFPSSLGKQRFGLPGSFSHPQSSLTYQHCVFALSFHGHNNNHRSIIMMATGDEDNNDSQTSTIEKTEKTIWNIPGLKKEATRLTMRCHKKVGKASTRLAKANEDVEEIRTKPDPTLEELEACPNVKVFEDELEQLKQRLTNLNILEEKLQSVKGGKNSELSDDILQLVLELEVNDEPPKRDQKPKKQKKKGPRTEAPRLPYFRYYSENNTEIRVGRRSQDNDELSCNPMHRDGADWWMHASGCPGSHVVIRSHDNDLDKDVIKDAAALAARQSKCGGNTIKVSLTRCRDVKKPPGAKYGLVQLVGKVQTVSVNMKEVETRLQRLDVSMRMNE